MKKNEEHLSIIKGGKLRLKKVADANGRTMRGQFEWMLRQAEKEAEGKQDVKVS